MTDFTSAAYLGLHHPSAALRPWRRLTSGRPAALGVPEAARAVAASVAALQGAERALLAPSTLHLAWDVLGVLGRAGAQLYVDAEAYPILQWGAERAHALGAPVRTFAHHDAEALGRAVRAGVPRPVVVTDGWCPHCGRAAPLGAYLEAVRPQGGLLVLDDTQALGVLGRRPSPSMPYGYGGGGIARWSGVSGLDVITIASLAKGFGVPVAVVSGSERFMQRFASGSETRVHCSPPSIAVVHAAERALRENERSGEALRARLLSRVRRFRRGAEAAGLRPRGGPFPVQTLRPPPGRSAADLQAALLAAGVRTVTVRPSPREAPRLCVLLRASHTEAEVDQAARALGRAAALSLPKPSGRSYVRTDSHERA